MKVPNAQQAIVDKEKVTGYLLSATSNRGRSKARFFYRFGYNAEDWKELAEILKDHGSEHEVERVVETVHGVRYYVEGPVKTPDRRNPRVVTVWQIDAGDNRPRLITAFPSRRRR